MRRVMNFIVSVGLICAGLYVLYEELFVRSFQLSRPLPGLRGWLALIGCGVVWLWFYVVGEIVLKQLSREE